MNPPRVAPVTHRLHGAILAFLLLCALTATSLAEPIAWGRHTVRTDRVIAKMKTPDPSAIRAASLPEGVASMRRLPTIPSLAIIELEPPPAAAPTRQSTPKDAASRLASRIKSLRASGLFDYVEPDYIVQKSNTPSDAAFSDGRLWGLRNTGQSGGLAGADIDALNAWQTTTGSRDVVVAVIDTGIRHTHQDLAANMWINTAETPGNGIDDDGNGYVDDIHGINAITGSGDPMDDDSHGTHCAGTIGAAANSGGPHVGVAWNVRLMGLKFLGPDGGSTSDAITCIDYAIRMGADVMSNSWGGGGFSQGLSDAIGRASDAGILFIAAAGNSADNNDLVPQYPASYSNPNVIAVAAVDRSDNLASFSCYGATSVDIGAPGVSIFSSTAESDTAYDTYNGTSMATPHVAGVAALILSANPSATMTEVRDRILDSARPLASLEGKCTTGGTLDAAAALDFEADGILETSVSTDPSPLRADSQATISIRVTDLLPVTGATVTGSLGGAPTQGFFDNGSFPDTTANDGIYTARATIPANAGSTIQLTLSITAPGKSPASPTFNLPVTSPPPNDNFADRAQTANGTTSSTGSNVNATSEASEPRNPRVAGGRSVWWSWTAPSTGGATISTAGSSFDTTLAIYTGSSLDALTLVGSNDDSSGLTSAVTFDAIAGTTYLVQVDGYSGATGSITLNHPAPGSSADSPPRIVQEPDDLAVLLGDPFSLEVDATGTGTLAYQWTLDGTPIPGATEATYSVSSSTLDDAGLYAVTVSNAFGQTTSRNISVAIELVSVRPPNDNFADASPLGGTSGRTNGTNTSATGENSEPDHAGVSLPIASVWWRWTAPADGTATFDTLGSNYDTTLAIYTGQSLVNRSLVGENDDVELGRIVQSTVTFTATAGTTYHIAVAGYDGATGQIILNHLLESSSTPPPPNDNFADAADLVDTTTTGSTIDATAEPSEPNHADASSPITSVWWRWTAPADGTATFDTLGSDYDTTLAIYTGDSPAFLEPIASNDDEPGGTLQSSVSFNALEGTTYHIAVDGYASSTGAVTLNRTFLSRRMSVVGDTDPLLWAPSAEHLRMRWSEANQRWEAMLRFRNPGTIAFKFATGPDWDAPDYGLDPQNPEAVIPGGDNLSISIPSAGYVHFAFDETTLTFAISTVTDTDGDEDGLADAWEAFFNVSDPTADDDNDAIDNRLEFLRGTDPRAADQPIHLAGDFNSWSLTASPMQHLGDGRWTATVASPTGSFKFHAGTWNRNWGASASPGTATFNSPTNIPWPTPAAPTFRVEFDELTLDYSITTSPFDQWLADNGLPADTDPLADPDGNGFTHLAEFALALDHAVPGHQRPGPAIHTTNDALVLQWIQPDNLGTITITPQSSATLDFSAPATPAHAPADSQAGVPANHTLMETSIPLDTTAGFLRLSISMP
jgi:subtilisin family serine protease